jgi:hypothetical protein
MIDVSPSVNARTQPCIAMAALHIYLFDIVGLDYELTQASTLEAS